MCVSSNNAKLKQTQAQVDEVVGIMRVNVEKVLERDQKLSELDSRADALQQGASQFEQQATRLKRKQWWANMKMMIIIGVIVVVILIIIIGNYYLFTIILNEDFVGKKVSIIVFEQVAGVTEMSVMNTFSVQNFRNK